MCLFEQGRHDDGGVLCSSDEGGKVRPAKLGCGFEDGASKLGEGEVERGDFTLLLEKLVSVTCFTSFLLVDELQ